jgi:hypothetical protein
MLRGEGAPTYALEPAANDHLEPLPVTTYRLYSVDAAGKRDPGRDVACAGDRAILRMAYMIVRDDETIEVWDEARLVGIVGRRQADGLA